MSTLKILSASTLLLTTSLHANAEPRQDGKIRLNLKTLTPNFKQFERWIEAGTVHQNDVIGPLSTAVMVNTVAEVHPPTLRLNR